MTRSFFTASSTVFVLFIGGGPLPCLPSAARGMTSAAHGCRLDRSPICCAVLAGTTSPPNVQYASADVESLRSWTRMDSAERWLPS